MSTMAIDLLRVLGTSSGNSSPAAKRMKTKKLMELTLTDLCVDTIVSNFDRFMMARTSDDSNIPPKHFEFLQRTQSKILLEKLSYTGNSLKNLDFLLNPYLKEIDLSLHDEPWIDPTFVVERLKSIGDTVTNLKLYYSCCANDHILQLVCRFPNLKTLSLSSMDITEEVLQNIGKHCLVLDTLDLSNCSGVTDLGIQGLCASISNEVDENENDNSSNTSKNYTLHHLDVDGTSVTTVGIAFVLVNFPNILTIKHQNVFDALYNLHVHDFQNNCLSSVKTYNLTELKIAHYQYYPYADVLKMCSLLCPRIGTLNLLHVTTQNQIDACAQFTDLKEVYFFDMVSADLSFFIESTGKNLTVLDITGGTMAVESLLQFCPKLERLSVRNTKFEPIKTLQNNVSGRTFQHLKDISLGGIQFGVDVMKSMKLLFSNSPNLEILLLRHARYLTLEVINSITGYNCMNSIREIDVSYSEINGPAAQELLSAAPNLDTYIMQFCEISFEDYEAMKISRPSVEIVWDKDGSDYSDYDDGSVDYDDVYGFEDYDYFDYDGGSDDYAFYGDMEDYDIDQAEFQ